jgi:hypothetical protein
MEIHRDMKLKQDERLKENQFAAVTSLGAEEHELARSQLKDTDDVQQGASSELSYTGGAADGSSTAHQRMTARDRMEIHRDMKLKQDERLKEYPFTAITSIGAEEHEHDNSVDTDVSVAEQVAFTPIFDGESDQRLPRSFETNALKSWFKDLDRDRDGFVTPRDLMAWCTSASCQGLVDDADLESLFHPSLPNFNSSPATAPCLPGNDVNQEGKAVDSKPSSSSQAPFESEAPHFGIDIGQVFDIDDLVDIAASSQPVSAADSPTTSQGNKDEEEFKSSRQNSLPPEDQEHYLLIRAAQTDCLQGSSGLHEVAFTASLARRPMQAARLVLMHQLSLHTQHMKIVETCANAALLVIKTAEAAAAAAVSMADAPGQREAQRVARATTLAAKRAAARTKTAWHKMGQSLRESGNNCSEKDEAFVHELEARIKEAEAKDPRGASAHAARRALQEHFLMGARRHRILRSIEVALEVKLLAWREAEHCPSQLLELRALIPLHEVSSPASEHPASAAASAARAEMDAKTNGWIFARLPSFMDKMKSELAGPSGHLNPMIHSLDDDDYENEDGQEQGDNFEEERRAEYVTSLSVKRNKDENKDFGGSSLSGQEIAHESDFDQEVKRTTTRFEMRLAASRDQPDRKKGRTRPLSSSINL